MSAGPRATSRASIISTRYLPEKTAALERWADHVIGLVEGRAAKVVPMKRKDRRRRRNVRPHRHRAAGRELIGPDNRRRAECVNLVNVALSEIKAAEADMRYVFHRHTKDAKKAAGKLKTAISAYRMI